ncbi:MAG TPA: formimidoylglutamase [Candidatus Kapabacteria bacterium]|nr:formimidoylglutamase [Candidatus Kapabacteria bacterium]
MNDPGDPRFGDLIRSDTESATSGDIVIVGVPTDEGILRNGGRVGAAQAPDEIRKYLRKLVPPLTMSGTKTRQVFDHRNVSGSTLEDRHGRASQIIKDYTDRGCFVIGLGGGHDITYPLVRGTSNTHGRLGLINVDAHLDVREKKNGLHHSGSSFRLLLEEHIIDPSRFVEFGIQPLVAAKAHADWVTDQGGTIYYYDAIRSYGVVTAFEKAISELGEFYLSFDIDSIRTSDAPGCSAPSPQGFSSDAALDICRIAAASGRLRGFDIVEVSPPFDIDGRTSRLAARMAASVLAGLAAGKQL